MSRVMGQVWGCNASRGGGDENEKEVVVVGEVFCFVYILTVSRQVGGCYGFQRHAGKHLCFERRAPAVGPVLVWIVIGHAWRKTAFTEFEKFEEEEEESHLSF